MSAVDTKVMDVFTHDMEKPEGELAPIEVVECTRKNLRIALGRRLVHPVLNSWEETFMDEDTGDEVRWAQEQEYSSIQDTLIAYEGELMFIEEQA